MSYMLHCISDRFDRGGFAKLFVGSVPRTATEGEVSQCNCYSLQNKCPICLLLYIFIKYSVTLTGKFYVVALMYVTLI